MASEPISSKHIQLHATDGHTFDAYVARTQKIPEAAVVIVQEIFGVNAHIRSVVDDYASEGFLAIAPALFDRVEPNIELAYDAEGPCQLWRSQKLLGGGEAARRPTERSDQSVSRDPGRGVIIDDRNDLLVKQLVTYDECLACSYRSRTPGVSNCNPGRSSVTARGHPRGHPCSWRNRGPPRGPRASHGPIVDLYHSVYFCALYIYSKLYLLSRGASFALARHRIRVNLSRTNARFDPVMRLMTRAPGKNFG